MPSPEDEVAMRLSLYEKHYTGNPEWLNFEITLSELGSFCNIFLPNIVSCTNYIVKHKEEASETVEMSKYNIGMLGKIVSSNDHLTKIVNMALDVLKAFPGNLESIVDDLEKISRPIYMLFYIRLKRMQISMPFFCMSKTRLQHSKAQITSVNKYIEKNLPLCCPSGVIHPDPLHLSSKEMRKLLQQAHALAGVPEPCVCGITPTRFAYPCNCPLGCEMCAPEGHLTECPVCGKTVKEVVVVNH